MIKLHPVNEFIQKSRLNRPKNLKDLASFCKEGVKLAFKYPSQKAKIAYEIVSENAYFANNAAQDSLLQDIQYFAGQLELPDHHVYTGDGTNVKEKWLILRELVDELAESQRL